MTQHIHNEFKAKNQDVTIFVDARVAINGGLYQKIIDSDVDFATAEWNYFGHNKWIVVPDQYKSK